MQLNKEAKKMSNIPNFDYLLVMPSGNVRGFEDIESAKGYVNN